MELFQEITGEQMSTINCPSCSTSIDIDDILSKDIKAQVIAEEHKKHAAELAHVKQQAEEMAEEELKAKLDLAEQKKLRELALEREKLEVEFEGKSQKESHERELLVKKLTDDAETTKEDNKALRVQLSELMDQLREEKKARDNAEFEAKKKLSEEEDKIREAAKKDAAEELGLKSKEIEKQLAEAKKEVEETKRKAEQGSQKQEFLIEKLTRDADSAREDSKNFRVQLTELMDQLREEKKARDNAELEAKKKFSEEADKIREEAKQSVDESHRLKTLEMEKKLADTQKALADAQRKAEQGSQQNQGEVLELDLENNLRAEFPMDRITEVKKGARGADITQVVMSSRMEECGILLWESKNATWQKAWIAKFKNDIREGSANIGIIVSSEMPEEYGDMHCLEKDLWVVKPKLARALASAMRNQIISVWVTNHNNENKDEKMEILYQFLTGPEFRHRIEAIVDNYSALQNEMEKEKRAAQLRWSKQEKSIRAVIDNTLGMYGALQGLTGNTMEQIEALEE